ncbi:MAG: VWA domain-containing protein [Anaerolineae bacterium]|nr:VWA domain-containing protein [Anaerolineae bacterium]
MNETPHTGGQLLHNLLLFGRVCKALGMDVTPNRMIDVAHALEYLHLGQKEDVYHALRALIVTRRRDLALFDEAFDRFWRKPSEGWITLDLSKPGEHRRRKPQFLPPGASSGADGSGEDNPADKNDPASIVVIQTYSQRETLRHKSFAEMTGEELSQARRLMAQLRWGLGQRKTRRFTPGKGGQLDPRRAFRRNMRYAGEPLEFLTRAPKIKPRRLVLLCDISGSMERYTRLLLHFMHTLANSIYQVESFVFSTRLTRITRPLRYRSIDRTLQQVSATVSDWGGGTITGEALHTFNFRWARRVLSDGAIVLIITDGWDRGDPALLRQEIARLQRNCYRLIWLNPLIAAPQYEPLTRGAQAMLPFVDDFLSIRNLANLETLARELQRVDWRRPERPAHAHLIVADKD